MAAQIVAIKLEKYNAEVAFKISKDEIPKVLSKDFLMLL